MAHNVVASTGARNGALNGFFNLLDSGFLKGYDGSQPANPATALSGNTLGFELALGNPAFAAAASGSKSSNAISDDTSANATLSPCTWASLFLSDNTTRHVDFTAGVGSSYDLQMTPATVQATVKVTCSGITGTIPAS